MRQNPGRQGALRQAQGKQALALPERGGEGAGEVAAGGEGDGVETEPAGESAELACEGDTAGVGERNPGHGPWASLRGDFVAAPRRIDERAKSKAKSAPKLCSVFLWKRGS